MGAQKAKREAEACTFKPKVAARSAALAAHAAHRSGLQPHQVGTLTERLNLQSQQREAKLDAERKRREAAELEKCTFKPAVKAKSPAAIKAEASGPVVARGARPLHGPPASRAEGGAQKPREQRAFLTEPPEKLQPYTVPEPFQLHEGRGLERRLALERAAREAAECPFEPKTNDPPTKALLEACSASRRSGRTRWSRRRAGTRGERECSSLLLLMKNRIGRTLPCAHPRHRSPLWPSTLG